MRCLCLSNADRLCHFLTAYVSKLYVVMSFCQQKNSSVQVMHQCKNVCIQCINAKKGHFFTRMLTRDTYILRTKAYTV